MIIVLCVISIVLIILILTVDEDFLIIPLLALGVKIIVLACLIGSIVNGRVIDNKIELIKNQNKEIETKVEITVKTYMNFEKETLTDLKADSYIQLINLYPDLKTNELIQNQIKLYEENNKKITELKEEKINISNYKWWVYFGR